MDISELLKFHGIKLGGDLKSVSHLPSGKRYFVPFEAITFLIETNPQKQGPQGSHGQDYLIFLDLNTKDVYEQLGEHGKVEIYKESDDKYYILQPILDVNKLFAGDTGILSNEFLQQLFTSLPDENKISVPPPYSEKDMKEHNAIYDKYLSKGYAYLWGTRQLKEYEIAKIILYTGHFVPKKPTGFNPNQLFNRLINNLSLQESVTKELINNINLHQIMVGREPINSGVVLFGPGGTGKTTIMRELAEVFKKLGAYVALNDENEFLKTSEVKNTKYYGAFQDYFAPKFSQAIREARVRGIPSFIPIDEGEIFVQKPSVSKNDHAPEVINFFKGLVGNHKEFVVVLATNVLREDLDPIATRKGRIATLEIPLPDAKIAAKLIRMFIKKYEIMLERELKESEVNELASLVEKNGLPGAAISHFCSNFYSSDYDYVGMYEKYGNDPNKVEEEIRRRQGGVVKIEEFILRFKKEVCGVEDNTNGSSNSQSNGGSGRWDETAGTDSGRYGFFKKRLKTKTGKKSNNNYQDEQVAKLGNDFKKVLGGLQKVYADMNNNKRNRSFFHAFLVGDNIRVLIFYIDFIKNNFAIFDDLLENLHENDFYDNLNAFLFQVENELNNAAENLNNENFINHLIVDLRFIINMLEQNLKFFDDLFSNNGGDKKSSEETEIEFLRNNDDVNRILNSQGRIWDILGYNNKMQVSNDVISQKLRILKGRFSGGISGSNIFNETKLESNRAKEILKAIAVLINLIADLHREKNKKINGTRYTYSSFNEFLQIRLDISNIINLFR